MNKFWSVLFFAVALGLTWYAIHSNSAVGSETHSGIQNELANLILQSVQAKKPNAKDLKITRLWTETIDDNKVHAVFAYSYTEPGEGNEQLQQTIEGEATLHREPSDDARLDKWVLQNVHTTGDNVTFSEGAVVTPAAGEDEDVVTDPSAPPAEEKAKDGAVELVFKMGSSSNPRDLLAPERTIAIDEEGYFVSGETRWTDHATGRELFENLKFAENGALVSSTGGNDVVVEAFDSPLVAQQVDYDDGEWFLLFPYGFEDTFDPKTLNVDEWDRFHGMTKSGLPFVFKRSAQAALFDAAEEFDDDSITLEGKRYEIPPSYSAPAEISTSQYWTNIYETEGKPRWDLGEPAEALKDMLPRLKLTKSRVLVLGCGEGHDAAHFAREGHIVTAVDLSPEALRRAKEHYGNVQNLKFLLADAFSLDKTYDGAFDIVFEHTFYCAIDPNRRQDLVRRWVRWLSPGGMLMGIFFAVEKIGGPPYGGTEWELRERLRKNFQFIFWGRWKKSKAGRQGKELFVYAHKLGSS